MTAAPPAAWISSIACSAVGQRAGDERLRAGHQVLLEEGAEVAGRAGGRAMWGRPIESASPASRTASSRWRSKPSRAELLDDLAGPGHPLVLGPLAGGGDRTEVDPVAADVEVFGELVDAGHLDRRHQLDRVLLGRPSRLGDPGDRVVVGQGQRRHARLGGLRDHLGRQRAGRRRPSSAIGARSTFALDPR